MTRVTRAQMLVCVSALLLFHAAAARAQTTTPYYLHHEPVDDFFTENCGYSLNTGTDATATAAQSADLKNHVAGVVTLSCFETNIGAPNRGGVIPAQSTITFRLWMKKTASWGVFYPQATLQIRSGTQLIDLCAQPATEMTTPIGTAFPNNDAFTLTCQTPASPIAMSTSDRLRLYVSFVINTVSTHSVKVELDFGAASDSKVTAPNPVPPQVSTLNPASAPVNWSVVIAGTNFGSSQGASTVKFTAGATATASVSAWSDTSITAAVPAGLTPGPGTVQVTVGGAGSNAAAFTVRPPPAITALTPTAAHRGDSVAIAGTDFMSTQGTSTVTFACGTGCTVPATVTSWTDTSIAVTVPSTATTGSVVAHVSGQDSNGVNFTVILPGTVAGTITQHGNGNPLSGATVQAVYQGVIKATATTPSDGSYSLGGLDPGTYDLRVYATNYSPEVRAVTITASSTTTVDVPMFQPGAIAGTVTQSDGVTPIAGAAVTVFSGPAQQGATNTDAMGAYSIPNLHPGTLTVQAVNVGNRTKEQTAVVTDNTTTTANLSLDPQPAGPVLYAYDAIGRLVQVTDQSGDSAIYRYDPVGNITSIERTGTAVVSVSGFTPTSGAVGTSVTISGTGFSATPNQNAVTFGCGASCTVPATVTSATATQLVVTVPATAVSGVIGVSAQGQNANAPSSFTVTTAGGPPTIIGFTPTLVAAADALTVNGMNFDLTAANDRLTTNVASAQVTSATATSLQATVPITTTGRVSILTQNGTATSTDYLWVAPAPYLTTQVDSTGSIPLGTDTLIQMNTQNGIAMRAFDSTQGHRAAVSVTGATFAAGGNIFIYGPYANPTSTGFATTGFLEPVDLHVSGTYTFILAPNSPNTGSATVRIYDVPADQMGAIALGGSVPVSLSVGQNARLTFTGAANDRVCATTTIPSPPDPIMASGTLRLLTPDGWEAGSTGFNSAVAAFLDATTLPSSGVYTMVIDPDTTSAGVTTAYLYGVPQDFSGTLTLNGSAVPVPLSTCQNGTLTFSGAANGTITVHATGSNFGGDTVTVTLLDADTGQQLSRFTSSSATFDLAAGSSPTGHYRVVVDPRNTASGTLTLSVSGS